MNRKTTLTPDTPPVLPDLLAPNLRVVFCGTAPGHVSAARGAYYAHPQNRFWRVLAQTGLTPHLLSPEEYPRLLDYGIGLTDISKFDKGLDRDLKRESLGHASVAALRDRIAACAPDILAFTSMTGGARFFGGRRACGPQAERIGRTKIWILPSTSGLACGSWDEGWWQQLARSVRPPTPKSIEH